LRLPLVWVTPSTVNEPVSVFAAVALAEPIEPAAQRIVKRIALQAFIGAGFELGEAGGHLEVPFQFSSPSMNQAEVAAH